MILQIVVSLVLLEYYNSYKITRSIVAVASAWRGDCSDVGRCWRFSAGLLNGGEKTKYVCSSSLSAQLPLWTNNRQCAECPELWKNEFETETNYSKSEACDSAKEDQPEDRQEK